RCSLRLYLSTVETHLFWNQVINILDPNDVLLYHMAINPKAPQSASHNHNNASHNHQNHSQSQTYLTPYQHLRGILNSSCLICRINYPLANTGLAQAKKLIYTMNLGAIPVCKEHDKRKTHFCWLCCRDSPTLHTNNNLNAQIGQGGFMSDAISGALGMSAREREREREREYDIIQALAIVENEDEDLWPGVVATCRKCRAEWLWRRASLSPRDAEAVGGPALHPSDWETRQNVEGFLDLGEGTVADLVLMAREKAWLRRWTRYDSLGMHFLGAARGAGGGGEREREHKGKGGANNSTNPLGGGFGMFGLGKDLAQNGTALANALGLPSPNPLAEEEEEAEGEDASSSISSEDEVDSDSEEDRELMLMRGATQVRDLALQDWCRQRILDGHWISPADAWFRNEVPGFGAGVRVPTTHPCPWAREDSNSTSGPGASRSLGGGGNGADPNATMDVPHPLESTLRCEPPATFGLAEQAFNTHVRQMKEILGPALRNVVRKVVMECSVYTPPSRSRNADGEEDVIEGGYEDPLRRVQRMDLEEVVRILREEEGVWYEGVDWLEKRRNEEEAEAEVRAARDRNATHREREQEDAAASPLSSASSTSSSEGQRSNNSNSTGTSPVLSTTTLQTTPSPPPVPVRPHKSAESESGGRGYQKGKAQVQDGEDDEQQTPQQSQTQTGQTQPQSQSQSQNAPSKADSNSNSKLNSSSNSKTKPKPRRAFNPTPRLIPIDPVRSPPRLLSKIPYVPVTVRHLPAYSLEALKAAWRDACAPLYHCRCSVCERAKMAEMNARAAAQGYSVPQQQQQVQYPPQQQQQQYAPPNVQQQQQVVQQPVTLSVPLRGGSYAPNANANLIELKEAVLERGPEARREEEEEEEELDDVDEYASDEDEVDYSEDDGYSDGYVDEDDLDDGEGEDADAAEQPPLPPPRPTQTQAAPGAKDVNASTKGIPATAPAETRTYSRKRSSDELLDEYGRDRDTPAAAAAALAQNATSNAATTPPSPKRQRIVGGDGEEGRPRSLSSGSEASEPPSSRPEEKSRYFPTRPSTHTLSQPPSPTGPPSSSPGRMRKRNSEELEEGVEVDADRLGKRAKVTLGEGQEVQEVASPDSVSDVPLPVAGREAVVGRTGKGV
ncbi:hypothetical protein CVT26_011916, partial [Gymnopilus dilepis]